MGGSWCSSGNVASKYARYHFRPHFQQHAGFRLVAPADASQAVDGAFITSCTDAPAPYVGEAYPFRCMHGYTLRIAKTYSKHTAHACRSSDPLKAKGYADAAMHSVNVALAAHYPNCKYLHQRQHMHVCIISDTTTAAAATAAIADHRAAVSQ
eukprot:15708-Heterococcus_DN1.PRE.2